MPIYSQVTGRQILEHLKLTAANAVAAQDAAKAAAAKVHAEVTAKKQAAANESAKGA